MTDDAKRAAMRLIRDTLAGHYGDTAKAIMHESLEALGPRWPNCPRCGKQWDGRRREGATCLGCRQQAREP